MDLRFAFLLLTLTAGGLGDQLDLSEWMRSGRQLGESDGVALGLVSALQKWANSLESKMVGLKDSNLQLVEELQQVKSENSKLNSQLTESDEKTINFKSLLQKLGEQLRKIEKENNDLKIAFQSQTTVMKSQQERIESNNALADRLRSQLSQTEEKLAAVQGKSETFTVTVTDKFLELQPVLQNITKSLHDFSKNASKLEADSIKSVGSLEKKMASMDLLHQQATNQIRNDFTQRHKDSASKCKEMTENLEKKLLENISLLDNSDDNLEREIKGSLTTLTTNFNKLKMKVDEDSNKIRTLRNFQADVRTNLDMIRTEINRSVDVLTEAVEKNVTESLGTVEGEVRKLEKRSTSLSTSLVSLSQKSDKLVTELNKLKSHTQRSVDTSAGLRSNMVTMEGKLSEVEAKNLILLGEIKNLNSSFNEEKEVQRNTVKGLERLGDSLASMKIDLRNKEASPELTSLKEKVEEVGRKQLSQEQEITRSTGRLNKVELDVNQVTSEVKLEVEVLGETLTNTRNTLAELLTKVDNLQSEGFSGSSVSRNAGDGEIKNLVNTLKTNVIGLGNYINTINREVNSLASKTRESIENVNQQVIELTADMKSVEDEVQNIKTSNIVGTDKTSQDFIASSLRTDVAGLSTKLYTLKTNVFEMTGELTSLKAGLETVNTEVQAVDKNLDTLSEQFQTSEKEDESIKSELGALKSGLSGLSNSVLTMRSKVNSIQEVEDRVRELSRNVTVMKEDVSSTKTEVSQLSPEISLIATDISALRSGISRMSVTVSGLSDPPRFSCGVTGEEVKVSGVISYDECAVNTEKMMNLGTGHATVPTDGDYLLSFSANMVSSSGQAVWCALYKQSPGDQGWQVLGMINNYQSEAGEEDDRDSGSLTVISSLKEGDQVWVEWRGYGDSFLYSNPYKLISFSGLLITQQL